MSYLPEALTEVELSEMIDQIVLELNASSMRDMGKIMGKVMPLITGRAEGKIVQDMVKKKLT
jgi:uncharacterized protein YqeY